MLVEEIAEIAETVLVDKRRMLVATCLISAEAQATTLLIGEEARRKIW
jgi:hypothetical protein